MPLHWRSAAQIRVSFTPTCNTSLGQYREVSETYSSSLCCQMSEEAPDAWNLSSTKPPALLCVSVMLPWSGAETLETRCETAFTEGNVA